MPIFLVLSAVAAAIFFATKQKAGVAASPPPPVLPPAPIAPSSGLVWSQAAVLIPGRSYRASFPFASQSNAAVAKVLYGVTFPGSTLYLPGDALASDWPSSDLTSDTRIRVAWTYNAPAEGEPISALGGRVYEANALPAPGASS